MERDTQARGMRTRGTQQRHGVIRLRAEFARQVQHGTALRQRQPHDQTEVARDCGRPRLLKDFRQLNVAVEHEVAHALPRPCLTDRAARLDRVHEVNARIGEHLPDQNHLVGRCAIEMTHAARPQRAQHGGIGIALHRVQNIARESRDEVPRRRGQNVRADAMHRLLRPQFGDQCVHGMKRHGERVRIVGWTAAERGNGGTNAQVGHRGNPHDSKRTRRSGVPVDHWGKDRDRGRRRYALSGGGLRR
jgi:hypothetical protein